MVIVEFYDENALGNICGALVCRPEKVILVGSDAERLRDSVDLYTGVLRDNNISTRLEYRAIESNTLGAVVDQLAQIIELCSGACTFDLTGGDELYLVAVGILKERYGQRVQCHRFNLSQNRLLDCDNDGKVPAVSSFDISVEDVITINGGVLVEDSRKLWFTYPWRFSSDFVSDIHSMWSVCREDTKLWNLQITSLGVICDMINMPSPLAVSFNQYGAELLLKKNKIKYTISPAILERLETLGLINSLYIGNNVSFRFKNEQVKKSLTTAGQVLELYVAACLLEIKDEYGGPLYHDVKVGAVINWDEENDNAPPIINEIDIIAMQGVIPVFISCKNGVFDVNELYKLNTVADRFGDDQARKVLITSSISNMGSRATQLIARMEETGIRCIDMLSYPERAELIAELSTIWKE